MTDLFFERIDGVGSVERVHPRWTETASTMLGSGLWREVTVTPVVGDDVIEQAVRVITEHRFRERGLAGRPTEPDLKIARPLARALAAAGLLAGSRTVTAGQREAVRERILSDLNWHWNPGRDPVLTAMFNDHAVTVADAALAALGLTVEEEACSFCGESSEIAATGGSVRACEDCAAEADR